MVKATTDWRNKEIEELKLDIKKTGRDGLRIDHIHAQLNQNADPIIEELIDSGDYVRDKSPIHSYEPIWAIFWKQSIDPK